MLESLDGRIESVISDELFSERYSTGRKNSPGTRTGELMKSSLN